MEKKEAQKALKEMLEQWDAKRSAWIEKTGSEKGFSEWFTKEVIG